MQVKVNVLRAWLMGSAAAVFVALFTPYSDLVMQGTWVGVSFSSAISSLNFPLLVVAISNFARFSCPVSLVPCPIFNHPNHFEQLQVVR